MKVSAITPFVVDPVPRRGRAPPRPAWGLMIAGGRHLGATMRYISNRLNVMYAGKIVETGPSQEMYSTPLHPYSQALLSAALPLHPSFRRSRIVLSGEVPSPLAPPSGCRFHPRCPLRMEICSEQEPLLQEAAPGRLVACHVVNKPE